MLLETIKLRLTERFLETLPEFHKRRIVFWLDEECEFTETVDEVALDGVTTVKLTGTNNFAVKKLLSADDLTGNYLVYDPLTHENDGHDDWLLDTKEYSGEPFRADIVSLYMEELLVEPSSSMRKIMKQYAKFFGRKERRDKIRKIGRTYQTPLALQSDVIAVLCELNGGTASDIIAAVLSAGLEKEQNPLLAQIEKFGDIEAFWALMQKYTGYIDTKERPLFDFAAHILITALSQTMPMTALKGLERFVTDACSAYCYQLLHEWQQGDHRQKSEDLCRHVENELRLYDRFNKTDMDALLKSDIFPAINECILMRFFDEIGERVIKADAILAAVESRRTAGWYRLTADYFECLLYTAKMQEFYLTHIQGFHDTESVKIWKRYIDSDYLMDSHYRHFHFHLGQILGQTQNAPNAFLEDAVKKCADVVEGLYCEWFLREMTANWTTAAAGDFAQLGYVSEIPKQRDFYDHYVKRDEHIYVIISDGLRYEVAAELAKQLNHATKGKATLEAVQAIFPSITKFGMAALLPGKEISVNEKLAVFMDGRQTDTTEKRAGILQNENRESIAVTYVDLLPMKQAQRRALLHGKAVVYIYHNTVDNAGEHNETKVFAACDDAINELTALIKIIVNDLSATNILITADHGFLYTYQPLPESQKISGTTFNGEIYERGRRHVLAAPDATADYLLPVRTKGEIGGAFMKGFAPQDTVRVKTQGGENYVHGGVSLQEIAVPVIVYKGIRAGSKKYIEVQNPGFSLISESRKISNMMFSLDFLQKLPVGEKVQAGHYTLRFTDEAGMAVSDTQTAIADRAGQNAQDRVFRIRFALKQMKFDRNQIYRLVIENDTDIPEEINFCVDIAFADDFGL